MDAEKRDKDEDLDSQATIRPMPNVAPSGGAETTGASREILDRLQSRGGENQRYELREELARGGMGVIFKVRDNDLRRDLAMKVVLGFNNRVADATKDVAPKTLGRFLEEAQVTGQLDHPGVVPVHHLGVDDENRVFFTMRLVKGQNLHEIFSALHAGEEKWSLTGLLWNMLKVCDAMAYAHSKQVVHRDLKPANVMVGRFGEVYVMDWGLARIIGEEDKHGLYAGPTAPMAVVESDRREEATASQYPDSHLFTVDGDVVGTPAYMAPEQARGEIDRLGARSDVYSAGAMIYHLLTGSPPYSTPEANLSQHVVLRWVLEGPPKPLHQLVPDSPLELIAICEKAMARQPGDRYADMEELAEDLRAYLENRVVSAYQTGAMAELKSWVRRNRPLAIASAVAFLSTIVGLASVGYVQSEERKVAETERTRAEDNERLAQTSLGEARRQEGIANRERANVLRLSAFQQLLDLREEADGLWPIDPERIPGLEAWLVKAKLLVAGLSPSADGQDHGHHRQLELLRSRGRKVEAPATDTEPPQVFFAFETDNDKWWYNRLVQLISEIEAFSHPEGGLIDGLSSHGWGVRRRLAALRRIEEETLTSSLAQERWTQAIASIRDVEQCPLYGGLVIRPQRGLLPIKRNEDTGLWEFCHIASGVAPDPETPDYDMVGEASGVVLVLLPEGDFLMGTSPAPSRNNYDRQSKTDEQPVRRVNLDAFFISKFELTQGQWARMCGARPSRFQAGEVDSGRQITDRNPVETISWYDATTQLFRLGLSVPTEAQWEYAARAGAESAWWSGEDERSLAGVANLNDSFAKRNGAPWLGTMAWLDDEHLCHAPVGTYAPNDFGLFEVHGNVFEWCRDVFLRYDVNPQSGTGERLGKDVTRVTRGGSFVNNASMARLGSRDNAYPEVSSPWMGVRPARVLSP